MAELPEHMVPMARYLERWLHELHPQYTFVVSLRDDERSDGHGDTRTRVAALRQPGVGPDHPHPILDGNDATPSSAAHDDRFKRAA